MAKHVENNLEVAMTKEENVLLAQKKRSEEDDNITTMITQQRNSTTAGNKLVFPGQALLPQQKLSSKPQFHFQALPSDQLIPGDIVKIKPNQTLTCDCIMVEGTALLNESALTGEPLPISKSPFDLSEKELSIAKNGKRNYLFAGFIQAAL